MSLIREITFYRVSRRMRERKAFAEPDRGVIYVNQAQLQAWIVAGDQVLITATGNTLDSPREDMTVHVLARMLARLSDQFTAAELHELIRGKLATRQGVTLPPEPAHSAPGDP